MGYRYRRSIGKIEDILNVAIVDSIIVVIMRRRRFEWFDHVGIRKGCEIWKENEATMEMKTQGNEQERGPS